MGKSERSLPDGWTTAPAEALLVANAAPVAEYDPSSTPGYSGDKNAGTAALAKRGEYLADLQEMLFANGRAGDNRSVLLVIQGMDTAGKGGIVRHVGGLVDPQGLAIKGFGKPTPEELSHDFLWRIHRALPSAGKIGIFDRSHYEDVLPVRVHHLVPESVWSKRYDLINQFERELVDAGTTVVKVALVVSPDEQKQRLTDRLADPTKFWKYNPGDVDERGFWDEYLQAYQAIFDLTNTDYAPWHIIGADRKWFSRLAVCELLIDALERLDLDWPDADFDLERERARVAAL
ncbi:polyphosphate kinase 2 family protein [Gordonia crocea]|uniref:Polyphosphate kinase n=1 Tax=Gordonia crocea TaxID=589162 RepID=A0A7I9UVF8_9ACTN|nr:polyphosphate kinase 2 family protein [Gordonia crocea]GED96740.1 polyphosphate kinase [Gordonia crocea]